MTNLLKALPAGYNKMHALLTIYVTIKSWNKNTQVAGSLVLLWKKSTRFISNNKWKGKKPTEINYEKL